jgi:hypothetical protein
MFRATSGVRPLWIMTIAIAAMAVVSLQARAPVARYTSLAVDLSGQGASASATVGIVIDRWSTEAERQRLTTVLVEQGPEKLLGVLRELPRVGAIHTPGGVGFDVRYAWRTVNADGSSRVVLLTDRPIQFWERWNMTRSVDYPFTLVELHLRPDGTGEGKLSLATKVTYDRATKTIMLERYSDQPVLLQKVQRLEPSAGA